MLDIMIIKLATHDPNAAASPASAARSRIIYIRLSVVPANGVQQKAGQTGRQNRAGPVVFGRPRTAVSPKMDGGDVGCNPKNGLPRMAEGGHMPSMMCIDDDITDVAFHPKSGNSSRNG